MSTCVIMIGAYGYWLLELFKVWERMKRLYSYDQGSFGDCVVNPTTFVELEKCFENNMFIARFLVICLFNGMQRQTSRSSW